MPQKQLNQKQAERSAKANKKKNPQQNTTKKRKERRKPPRIRIFPIWLRIIVITIIALLMLALGLMFGYGIVGDGEPLDALKYETWRHIIDIVVGE